MSDKNNYNIVGFDAGTGNIVSAKLIDDKIEINKLRNMYVLINDDSITAAELTKTQLEYITKKDNDGDIEFNAIIGNDCLLFSNMYNKVVNRPMSDGLISTLDKNADIILNLMCEKLVGKPKHGGTCVFSIPSEAIDKQLPPIDYHELKFTNIFTSLGYTEVKALNEATSIIFSECSNNQFTGLGISFGAGLTNLALCYKGQPIIKFSIARGGDWIDFNAGKALNIIPNRITSIKEKELNLKNINQGDKKKFREREAILFYYKNLINYVIDNFMKKFNEVSENLEMDDNIPIILSGGTSIPEGFVDLFSEKFRSYKNFPYNILEIRQAKDPLNAVANGCLIYAKWLNK